MHRARTTDENEDEEENSAAGYFNRLLGRSFVSHAPPRRGIMLRTPRMNYFVLKQGDTLGPFSRDEIVAQLAQGTFEATDFGQVEGTKHWAPLSQLLDPESAAGSGALAPDWKTILVWVSRRARHALTEQPMHAGFFCVAIGFVFVLLSWWSPLLWMPWFLTACFAGILLFRRGAAGMATALLACALLATIIGWVLRDRVAAQTRRAQYYYFMGEPGSDRAATPAPDR